MLEDRPRINWVIEAVERDGIYLIRIEIPQEQIGAWIVKEWFQIVGDKEKRLVKEEIKPLIDAGTLFKGLKRKIKSEWINRIPKKADFLLLLNGIPIEESED